MAAKEFEFTGVDGVVGHGRRWMPAGAPRAVVQIAHGMAEHSARYERFAAELTGAGYAVWANDHRGHGRTGERGTLGHFEAEDGWGCAVEDLRRVSLLARESVGDAVPLVLLGHSMGSLLARSYAARWGDDLAGLVLSGTPADPGLLARIGRSVAKVEGRLRGAAHPSTLLDRMSFGAFNKAFQPARTDFDWLSRDEEAVDSYVADPLCGFVCTDGFYAAMLGGLTRVNRHAGLPAALPVLIISGAADPAGNNGDGVRPVAEMMRAEGVHDVTLTLYPGARHEIVQETNRDVVVADVLTWLDAHLPPSA